MSRALTPRVWEVSLGDEQARLRIDRAPDGGFVGRFKVYASRSAGMRAEQLEQDVDVASWDGSALEVLLRGAVLPRRLTAVAGDRTLEGTFTDGDGAPRAFTGTRVEVLSYGLSPRAPEERAAWQEETRRRLAHLVMAGNPSPLSREVVPLAERAPVEGARAPGRDDGAAPAAYRLRELRFDWTLPDPLGGAPLRRSAHAYLAVPSSLAEGRRVPAVIALNGHGGSAYQVMSPGSPFWYGDSFARHGHVVLAIDVSHRPDSPLHDLAVGDDPAHGNGPHPSLRGQEAPGSDFEEDGERAWDAMHALDWLIEQPFVDGERVLVTGLGLGAEVATWVAALDPRVGMLVAAGFAPDLGVMRHNGSHPCWRWTHGDVRDYIDVADLHALIAPRPLILESGRADGTQSRHGVAMDKQVARRARAAWGAEAGRYVHYVHDGAAVFRVGGDRPGSRERGVRTPLLIEPRSPWSTDWQLDPTTEPRAGTLHALVSELWRL
ncbi:MAG: hypothetical protein IT372_38720 [Polyangiaceae bacterium]|nr:hypothetical protein [Polyangiaceae bacterium]